MQFNTDLHVAAKIETANTQWLDTLAQSGIAGRLVDLETSCSVANDAFWALLGLCPGAEDTQAALTAHLHPADLCKTLDLRAQAAARSQVSKAVDLRVRHAEGGWRSVRETRVVHARDAKGRPTRILMTYADITAQKAAEAALEQKKSQFVSDVSHELRTPVTALRSVLFLLGKTLDADCTAKQAKLLGMASENCEQLAGIVTDILRCADPVAACPSEEEALYSAQDLLQAAITAKLPQAQAKGLSIETDLACDGAAIFADAARFATALDAVLCNAVKFSPAGGSVQIRTRCIEGTLRIEIADQGAGIAADMHDAIFERFTQIWQSTLDKPDGTGAGLFIARALVTAMNGQIGVESTPGQGATFWMEFAAEMPAAALPQAA